MQGVPVLYLSTKEDYWEMRGAAQEFTDGRVRGFFAGTLFVQVGLNTYPL